MPAPAEYSYFNSNICHKVTYFISMLAIFISMPAASNGSMSFRSYSKCELTWASNSAWGTPAGNFAWHIGQMKYCCCSRSWAAICWASSESESKISLHWEHGRCGSPRASTNLWKHQITQAFRLMVCKDIWVWFFKAKLLLFYRLLKALYFLNFLWTTEQEH